MPPVSVLIKPASGSCNMRCDYCFYCDEASLRRQAFCGLMTPETLKNVIRRCVVPAERSCSIAFQGGEPTLCGLSFFEKAVEYAGHYKRSGVQIRFALQTNGYSLSEEWCRFFVRNHFLVGVSVDGVRETHDCFRRGKENKPSYEQVMRTISLFDRYGVDYNILTVVHRKIAENIRSIYQDYRKREWNYLQFIACLDPLGQQRGNQPWSLLPESYGQFLIDLFDCWYTDYLRGEAPSIRQFENWIGICLGITPESCEQRGNCSLQYVVEADGSVYPCDFYALDEWLLGNLNRDRLPQIDERRKTLGFCARSRRLPSACQACEWLDLCRGGCFRNRLETGETDRGMNYFCQGYRMFFDRWGNTIRKIANQIRKENGSPVG